MRFTFVAATLAACHLMWGTAALGYNMYVADPKAGMIYGYEDAGRDPMPAPVLISGQVSLEAWDLVFLSGTESAFISGQNVVAFNSASGRLDLVHAAAPEEWIAAIGYGLNENNFVFAVVDRDTNEITIHDATRAGFGESWTTETYIHPEPSSRFGRIELIKTGEMKFALNTDSGTINFLDYTATPPAVNEITTGGGTIDLYPGPFYFDRQFIAAYNGTEPVVFFDEDGNDQEPPHLDSEIFDFSRTVEALHFRDDPYRIAAVSRQDQAILGDEDSFSSQENFGILYSPRDDPSDLSEPIDPARDATGVTELAPLSGVRWTGYDWPRARLLEIDPVQQQLTEKFVYEVGTGPEIGNIKLMDMGPDGWLYLLTERNDQVRLMRIWPSSGEREMIASELPRLVYQTFLVVAPDEFLVMYRQRPGEESQMSQNTVSRFQVQPGGQIMEADIETLPALRDAFDSILLSESSGYHLLPASQSALVQSFDGTSLSPESFSGTSEDLAINENTSLGIASATGTIEFPASSAEAESFLLSVHFNTTFGTPWIDLHPITFSLTSPEGQNFQGSLDKFVSHPKDVLLTAAVATSSRGTFEGTWNFEITFEDNVFDDIDDASLEIELTPRPVTSALQIDSLGNEDVMLYEPRLYGTSDAHLIALDLATGETNRTRLIPPAGDSAFQNDKNLASQFRLGPNGSYAYLSLARTLRLYRIDLQTGEMTMLLASRPGDLPNEAITPEGDPYLDFTFGPDAALRQATGTSGWTMY